MANKLCWVGFRGGNTYDLHQAVGRGPAALTYSGCSLSFSHDAEEYRKTGLRAR